MKMIWEFFSESKNEFQSFCLMSLCLKGELISQPLSHERKILYDFPPMIKRFWIWNLSIVILTFLRVFKGGRKKDHFQHQFWCNWKFIDLSEKVTYFEISCLFTVATISNFRKNDFLTFFKTELFWRNIFFGIDSLFIHGFNICFVLYINFVYILIYLPKVF